MCGLVYIRAPHLAAVERETRVANAISALRHRGPDASGIQSGSDFTLGHVRLAIVALEGGHQPLRDPTGRWSLAFNGEIYNYRSLRASLEESWDFRDASDTEVLLAGMVTKGASFVSRLDGMWAFVLHDAETGDVLLSRDRFGKKPLYYRVMHDQLACASELPALRRLCPDGSWSEAPAGISDYFRYGYTMPGNTCLQGVHELLPAHCMRIDRSGRIEAWRYWTPDTSPWQGDFGKAAREVRTRLEAAVASRQLAADVEVGAFLSGGVDSTVVCALAGQGGFGRLATFTAGFAEPTYDERDAAARAAAALGTRHASDELSPAAAIDFAASLAARLGQPFGDASIVPTALVSRLAARSVKVVLTGDGGDEVFGGYARYAGRRMAQLYRHVPASMRSALERAVLSIPEPPAHHSGSLLKRAHLFIGLARESQSDYVAPAAIRSEVLFRLLPGLAQGNALPELPWPACSEELRHMMLMDWLIWLPQDILAKVDRATMAFSLEARSPFLDRELVEFVIRLPWRWHFSGLRGKRLLRAAMRGAVPDFVWRRRKQGFASPVAHWMRGRLGDDLAELAASQDTGPLDRRALAELLQAHRNGVADHSQPLWLASSYLRWRAEGLGQS